MTEKVNILFLDDEKVVPILIKEILKEFKYNDVVKIFTASSSNEALELFKSKKVIHILVQDELRDKIRGIEFSKLLSSLNFYPLIYYVSAYYSLSDKERFYNSGRASYFTTKPIIKNDILSILELFVELVLFYMANFEGLKFYESVKNIPHEHLEVNLLKPYFSDLSNK